MENKFKYEIGESVKMALTEERGVVTARAEYQSQAPQYYVLYKAADGRQVENWFSDYALSK